MLASLHDPFTCVGYMNWLIFPINKLTYTRRRFEELSLQNVDYKPRDKIQLLMRLIAMPECIRYAS